LLEQRTLEEEQKLAVLRALASEGFAQLDQGRGLAISGHRQLDSAIARIGRRAAKQAKRNTLGQ
jgi:antitoxin ParD1/3/4